MAFRTVASPSRRPRPQSTPRPATPFFRATRGGRDGRVCRARRAARSSETPSPTGSRTARRPGPAAERQRCFRTRGGPPMISPRTSTAGPRLQHEVGEHRWPCREVMPARTRVLRWLRAFLDTSPNTDTIKSITPPTSGTPQRYAIVREQREVLVELGTAEGPLERAMASSHLSVITDRLIQSQRRAQITHILSTQRLRWSRVRASAAQGTRRPIMIFRSGARDSEQPCPRHQT